MRRLERDPGFVAPLPIFDYVLDMVRSSLLVRSSQDLAGWCLDETWESLVNLQKNIGYLVLTSALVLGIACDRSTEDTPDVSGQIDVGPDVVEDEDIAPDGADAAPVDEGWPPYGVAYDPYVEGIDVPACATYGGFGPYRVGVRQMELDGQIAEVWYPVDREYREDERWDFYDMREWLPEADAAKIGDEDAPLFVTRAVRDEALSAAPGRFPVVIFSHGFGAYRYQSSFLTTHLASWGYIVAATDHPSRTLQAGLSFRFPADESPDEVRSLVDGLSALNEESEGEFGGKVDLDRVAITGHSAGARTSSTVLGDPRFHGAILYAGAGREGDEALGKPLFVLGGDRDGIIPEESIRTFYDQAAPPARYAMIADAGHLAFSDICVIARDEGGLLPYARQFGINVPALFDRLASDGCGEDDLLPEKAWPMINHISVSFLRHLFEEDAVPVGLAPEELEACFGELLGDRDVKEAMME